jgi:hypothetical protein
VPYDNRSGVVGQLNASAAAVWMLLDGTLDLDALGRELSSIFEPAADAMRPDVGTALASLVAQGLLAEGPAATGPR